MKKAKEFTIDKSSWKKTKLGDLAEDISVRVEKPRLSKYNKFVGLEHILSGELKVRSWGKTDNLGSAMKEFQSGDILFARRNAYLRRASLVEFDGICSGDAFVLRENHNKLVPSFLSFIVNSNKLWDFANSNAAGTMSKRVKWRDLANYEFLLPPKEEQAKLAKLLWAADNVVEKDKELLEKLEKTMTSLFINSIFKKSNSLNEHFGKLNPLFEVKKLFKVISEFQYGISESLNEKAIGIPILRMNNLLNGSIVLEDLKYFSPKGKELDDFILEKGDVLFNRTNSFELVGKVGIFEGGLKCSFASYLIRLKTNRNLLDPRFLNYYLNSSIGLRKIRKYRTPGVSQSNINASNLKNVPIPIPKIEFQKELMDKIELLEFTYKQSQSKLQSSQALLKSLINKVFQ